MTSDDDIGHDDQHDEQQAGGLFARPFLVGIVAGIVSFFIIASALPPLPEKAAGAHQGVRVAIATTDAHATQTEETPQEQTPHHASIEEEKLAPALATAPSSTVSVQAELAVVVTDVGLNSRVAAAIDKELPNEATIAVSVYASDPAGVANAFKKSGRDTWLQIASQSLKPGIDPGPLAVSATMSARDNAAIMNRQIDMAGGAVVGIYIPSDADITTAPVAWRDMATDLITSNMLILDATSAKIATSLYMQKSDSKISAYLKSDFVFNSDAGPAALKAALDASIPAIINKRQAIIVLNRPSLATIDVLGAWVKTLPERGLRVVPATRFTGLTP